MLIEQQQAFVEMNVGLLAIVGLSGNSKSTLLEILAVSLSPSPPLTVREMLLFSTCLCLATRLPFKDIGARVEARLDNLTLRRVAATGIKDLSGGERRRISIGVEAVHDPPVLILDEPTSGLDSASALQIVGALRAMAETRGRTVLLSIHQPGARIVKMFDSVLLLAAGCVLH